MNKFNWTKSAQSKATTVDDQLASKPKQRSQLFLSVSLKEKIFFIKRLAQLTRAGIPLLKGLNMLKDQTKSRSLKYILEQVCKDVESGAYLATSLAKFRKIFGDFSINIIEVGEVSGTLSENLDYLAVELKKSQTLKRKVIGSMVYPVFIVLATFGITALLTIYVFPKILPIFKSVNFDLPWTTKSLIFVSNLLLHHGQLILLGIIALAIIFWLMLRIKNFKFFVQKVILSLPLIGTISQGYNVTNIFRTMGILIRSNVPIVRSLNIVAHTTNNLVYSKELEHLIQKVLKGEPISAHLSDVPKLFPPLTSQMLTVAENTGNLGETFLYLADMYEEEINELTTNISTIIEPLLLIFMGLLVGFVAISIITPIYGITQHLTPH